MESKKGTQLTRNGKLYQTNSERVLLTELTSDLKSKLNTMLHGSIRITEIQGDMYLQNNGLYGPLNWLVMFMDSEAQTWLLYLSSDRDLVELLLD